MDVEKTQNKRFTLNEHKFLVSLSGRGRNMCSHFQVPYFLAQGVLLCALSEVNSRSSNIFAHFDSRFSLIEDHNVTV